MATAIPPAASYHVLLVGIDNYPSAPLNGCVNDIDAVQRVLLGDRVGIPPGRIRRLASPNGARAAAVPEQPATLANLRTEFGYLGSNAVGAGDRVFIYYSGHGSRVAVAAGTQTIHREAMVPVDFDRTRPDPGLLFDFEINQLLRQIVGRTRNVTIILDCCYAAGATRSTRRSRFIDLSRLPALAPLPAGTRSVSDGAGEDAPLGQIDDCHVVSACLNHEVAQEERGRDGVHHGLLTRAFIEALDKADADLRTITWARIWQSMLDQTGKTALDQHFWMAGNPGRAVLAGPPVEGDAGLPVARGDNGTYRIAAGRLAGITRTAQIAIYGAQPAYFSALGSAEDLAKRIGVVRVIADEQAAATAEPVARIEGPPSTATPVAPFEIPPGARGRLIEPGEAERLRCSVVPADPAVIDMLRASPLLWVDETGGALIKLEQVDRRWILTDDVHGTSDPTLFALLPGELASARALLEHYTRYALPLRMAERLIDRTGEFELDVLVCPSKELLAAQAQTIELPEAQPGHGRYALTAGARVCFRVRNTSSVALRVTLVNSAASGKVQLLGDQVVDARTSYVFWARNVLGAPFTMTPAAGKERCIDRLTAIGRTAMDVDLSHLRVDQPFEHVVRDSRGPKDIGDGPAPATKPLEKWIATQVVIDTRVQ